MAIWEEREKRWAVGLAEKRRRKPRRGVHGLLLKRCSRTREAGRQWGGREREGE
jgi:hypothetical protein